MKSFRQNGIPLQFKKIVASQSLGYKDFISKSSLLFSWLYPELRPYRRLAIWSWLVVAVSGAVSASPIIIARRIVDNFQDSSRSVALPLFILAGAILAMSLLGFLSSLLVGLLNFKLRHSLEIKFARKIASTPLAYYENNTSGNISLTPFMQIPILSNTVNLVFRHFIRAGLAILIALAVMFYISFYIGIFCLVLVPSFFLGIKYFGKSIQRSVARTYRQISNLHSHFLESLLSVKSIRVLGISEKRILGTSRIVYETMRNEIKMLLLSGSHRFLIEVIFTVGVVLLLLLLRIQFTRGLITLPLSVAALTGFGVLAHEAKYVSYGIIEIQKIVGACSQLVDFLEQPQDETTMGSLAGPEVISNISMEGIIFSYGRDQQVLKGVDMAFPRGMITGIVGESGAGKSTCVDLLLRLRTAQSGKVLINGDDIAQFKETWIRRVFGFVDQEPYLFNTTIRENLTLAASEISEKDILNALSAASALGFISELPEKLDTRVGEGGALLSAGEKQRITLARALMKRPSVLVLDEITSSVDPENELIILRALRDLSPSMIIILISHKQSVTKYCDRIYRLQNGKAVLQKD